MSNFGITEWRGREIFTLATEQNLRAMNKAALLVERDVKMNFTKQGTGRKYGKHTASIAGQPPAIDIGVLHSSVISDVSR